MDIKDVVLTSLRKISAYREDILLLFWLFHRNNPFPDARDVTHLFPRLVLPTLASVGRCSPTSARGPVRELAVNEGSSLLLGCLFCQQ